MTTSRSFAGILPVGIIALTLGTAFIHLYLGFSGLPLFVLNGLGYLALLMALYLPLAPLDRYRNMTRWVLIGYTALTIVLWIIIGARTSIGYMDKLIEVALIVLLVLEVRRTR